MSEVGPGSMLGWALLIVGGLICLLNLYLSALRYPMHRMLGRDRQSYRWVSGVPLIGSLAVVCGWTFWARHQDSRMLDVAAWSLALLDTGGIHWFAAIMGYRWLSDRDGGRS
jgi:hypothetical protein